jgi:hypothetical protein
VLPLMLGVVVADPALPPLSYHFTSFATYEPGEPSSLLPQDTTVPLAAFPGRLSKLAATRASDWT